MVAFALATGACGDDSSSDDGGEGSSETGGTETDSVSTTAPTSQTATDTQTTGTETDSATGVIDLEFDGIESAEWDGADGLIGTWTPGTGDGELSYTLFVESLETGDVVEQQTLDLDAAVAGLADGEYKLWVEAEDEGGSTGDGDRFLIQLVGDNRIVLRSEVPLEAASDVWGQDEIVVLAGWESDVSFLVVDTSDVENPEVLATVEGFGMAKDIKLHEDVVYTSSECQCQQGSPEWDAYDQIGARTFDLSDPANPMLMAEIGDPTVSVHNVYAGGGYLYLADNITRNMEIFDVSDPADPMWVGSYDPPSGWVHDMAWVDDRVYVAFLSGFSVVDATDPQNPVEDVVHEIGAPFDIIVHNIWPSKNADHVMVTEERPGGHLNIWDVTDPMTPMLASEWMTDPESTIHNVFVRGDFAYAAYYIDGLWVVDVEDPTMPFEVGWYDSFDEDAPEALDPVHSLVGSRFDGAWSVWPFGPHIALSDMRRGLLLFDQFPNVVMWEG